ncbi:sensor histidine kinase [Streptomyces sp. PSKA54]|uniref:histidine kinase n=1 Tax=Streptomyces himalayensis subsp. aureolus TaxID=2758039 RepID=A0A7W2HGR3_9ACTN|nr:sensor histidine kinase [Streptomyces himalayensis]MBA4863237.1 sensor histidine kinase [Streptomyces himalayensis subsp. aureolus]
MTPNLEQYAARYPRAGEVAVSLVTFGLAVFGSSLTTPDSDQPTRMWPAVLLAGIACLALLRHRTHPRTAVAVSAVCTMITSALGYLLTPLLLAPVMAALYWLAALTDRKTTRVYASATTALLVVTAVIADPVDHPLVLRTIGPAFWLLVPVAGGTASRLRRAYVGAIQARAEHAERTREEEARHRVSEERMRIARELHDVVAHHLALANAQAGTAAHLARTNPEQTQKILSDLAATTASALREMKATVSLLRQADDPDTSLEPSPGLARLPELTSACESAGLKVTVTTEGEPRPLSPGVDLTAFRIVQEALTNVSKHAAAAAAHVRLSYSYNQLTIAVTDDGTSKAPTTPPPGKGFGLIGMRERAQSIGGDLQAGHRPEGGFEVTTSLPLHSYDTEPEEATTP